MTETIRPVLLGELLTRAGILTPEMLESALQRSKETQLPLGKIVTWAGYINDVQLQAAIEAQSLINDHLLSLEVGINAVRMVLNRSQSLNGALDELGWAPGEVFQRNRLGDLLKAAGMVTHEQLEEALSASSSTSLPLGQVLTCMPDPLGTYVRAALSAQMVVREGKVSRTQAIDALRLVKEHLVGFDEALLELGIRESRIISTMEISELLLASGVITQSQMMRAVDRSFDTEQPLSRCLIELAFINENTLLAARELRDSIRSGMATRSIALDAMRQAHREGISASDAIAAAEEKAASAMPKISAVDLLRLAALVTDEDLRRALPAMDANSSAHADPRKLLSQNAIDEATFRTLLDCLALLEKSVINLQQAIVALHICLRQKMPLSEALKNLGVQN